MIRSILPIFLLICTLQVFSQTEDTSWVKKEYRSLEEAMVNPERVVRLNLSNQTINIPDSAWKRFSNLRFLSLRNDHLKKIPEGIGLLKSLTVLDLSGNDFAVLPRSFSQLSNLKELYINDDRAFNLKKNLPILRSLPRLSSLHLEADNITDLPKGFEQLSTLDSLYLSNNRFKKIPAPIMQMKNLKFLDFHDNKMPAKMPDMHNQTFGIKIRF